jgi:hypothetical protein
VDRRHGASRLAPAKDCIAHAVEEAAASLLLLAAHLRLQLLDAGVGALERLILDQRRLHKRIDCVRRPSQSISNEALGVRVAGTTFQLGQTIEQFVHKFLLLWGHGGSPSIAAARLCGLPG